MISLSYEVSGQASRQDGGRDEGGVSGHCVDRFFATFKSKWVGKTDIVVV